MDSHIAGPYFTVILTSIDISSHAGSAPESLCCERVDIAAAERREISKITTQGGMHFALPAVN